MDHLDGKTECLDKKRVVDKQADSINNWTSVLDIQADHTDIKTEYLDILQTVRLGGKTDYQGSRAHILYNQTSSQECWADCLVIQPNKNVKISGAAISSPNMCPRL